MKLKLTWLLTLFMAFVMQLSFGQEKDITGTVTAASDGLPLPGVTVLIKGTTKGTQTDFDGKYTIKAQAGDILVFSFVSMKTTEKTVGSGNVVDLAMADDVASLDEVVITGYSTTTKAKSSVSSVRVSSETIENRPNASFVQTLSGQVPGLNITTSNGQPGGNSLVQIRGVSSINGNTEPLFIIDGAPVDEDNFRSLNPQDIASIDVLKDAGATAIYGNRGANGVIVIKTRQGGFNQGLKIGYQGFISFSNLQGNDYNRMNAQELLRFEREIGNGAGAGATAGKFDPNNATNLPLTDAQIDAAPDFDWTDFFFRTGVTQSHTVTLSSGSENSSQFTSFGFQDTEGVLQESDLKRFNLRSNVTGKSSNGKFNYGTNITMNYSTSNEPNGVGGNGINQNFVLGAYQAVPYITPDDYINGRDLTSPLSFTNTPLFLLDKLENFDRIEDEVKIIASANFSYKLTDDLTANLTMSADYQYEQLVFSRGPLGFNAIFFGGDEDPATPGSQVTTPGFVVQNNTQQFLYNQVTSLNYSKSFGKHSIDAGLYTEYFKGHFEFNGFQANGLNPTTFVPGDGSGFVGDVAAQDVFVDIGDAEVVNGGLFSYFGSLDYDYDEKYGLSGTLRRDASFRFSGSNRWATFWSVSGRWNISNEDFMEDSVVNNLKLRASYGTAGNSNIAGNGFFGNTGTRGGNRGVPTFQPDLTEDFFATGGGLSGLQSLQLSQFGNRNLLWETVASFNVGVDFGVWNNRLRGSVDFYERKTEDLFQDDNISATAGTTRQRSNTGNLFNTGADFIVSYDIFRAKKAGDFEMSVDLNGNFNQTRLEDLPSTNGEIIGTGRNGGILNEYFTLRYAGVNPANGELLFLDANDNLTESPDANNDRVWLDKNIIPEFVGGFNFNFDYKGFFLTTQFNLLVGVDRFDTDLDGLVTVNPQGVGQFNYSRDVLRYWRQPGDITDIPSPFAANRVAFASDRFLRSADYLRLRFASFGYGFSQEQLKDTGFTKARVFVNAENILTWSEWRGFDPETRSNGGPAYPTPRTISFGLELGF